MARAPNDVSYNNNTFIPGVSIHFFPKDVAVWSKWTRFDIEEILLINVVGVMLRAGFENGCYEHIP